MPFTIGGDYISKSEGEPTKKIKVIEIKRRGKNLTQVLYVKDQDAREVLRFLKKECHSGGSYKDGVIELQGHLKEKILAALRNYPNGELNL